MHSGSISKNNQQGKDTPWITDFQSHSWHTFLRHDVYLFFKTTIWDAIELSSASLGSTVSRELEASKKIKMWEGLNMTVSADNHKHTDTKPKGKFHQHHYHNIGSSKRQNVTNRGRNTRGGVTSHLKALQCRLYTKMGDSDQSQQSSVCVCIWVWLTCRLPWKVSRWDEMSEMNG